VFFTIGEGSLLFFEIRFVNDQLAALPPTLLGIALTDFEPRMFFFNDA